MKDIRSSVGLVVGAWLITTAIGCAPSGHGSNTRTTDRIAAPDLPVTLAKKYPMKQYITAWGYSKNSAHEAELDAKARISEQIASRIQAETKSVATAQMENSVVTDSQYLESSVNSVTSFDRAELIQCIVDEHPLRQEAEYRAFGYLSRVTLGTELAQEYLDYAVVFRTGFAHARAAFPSPMEFTPAWHTARSGFRNMVKVVGEYQAVTGLQPASWTDDRAQFQEMAEMRSELLGQVEIAVQLQDVAELDTEAIAAAINGALSRLGLKASGGTCRPTTTLLMELKPKIRWYQLIGAQYCQASFIGLIHPCSNLTISQPIVITGKMLEGSGKNPLANLVKRVTPELLAPLLEHSLSAVLPVWGETD